jgi:hypothetical protein
VACRTRLPHRQRGLAAPAGSAPGIGVHRTCSAPRGPAAASLRRPCGRSGAGHRAHATLTSGRSGGRCSAGTTQATEFRSVGIGSRSVQHRQHPYGNRQCVLRDRSMFVPHSPDSATRVFGPLVTCISSRTTADGSVRYTPCERSLAPVPVLYV